MDIIIEDAAGNTYTLAHALNADGEAMPMNSAREVALSMAKSVDEMVLVSEDDEYILSGKVVSVWEE